MKIDLKKSSLKSCMLLAACFLLMGCSELLMLAGPKNVTFEYEVEYAARGPEYVYRNLGGNRYLLAQAYIGSRGLFHRMRYYDRNTGTLTRLPDLVAAYRKDGVFSVPQANAALRYRSDNPQQIVFYRRISAPDSMVGIILSLDGGKSFAQHEVRIPISVEEDQIEFIDIKQNTAYLGIYLLGRTYYAQQYTGATTRNWLNKDYQAVARYFPGDFDHQENIYRNNVYIAVFALPLPGAGEPVSAAAVSMKTRADQLLGADLLAYDLGQPISKIYPPKPPPVLYPQYSYADRQAYIEKVRDQYPKWAAAQTNHLPWFRRYGPSSARFQTHSSDDDIGDDPVEWVKFD